MTQPIPPESFFEGGAPQSEISPGDTGRELVHEVRNLNQAILLLKAVAVPRHEVEKNRRRAQFLGMLAVLVALVTTGVIGYAIVELHKAQADFRATAAQTCEDRNADNAAFLALVTGIGKQIEADRQVDNPESREQTLALFEAFATSVKPIDCSRYLSR